MVSIMHTARKSAGACGRPEPGAAATDGPACPTVQVVMAVFEPAAGYLAQQLASLAAQEGVNVVLTAVMADLRSATLVERLARDVDLDVHVCVPPRRMSSVTAFEYGLSEVLRHAGQADLVALCDQDDVWDADKLLVSVRRLRETPGAALVHTDARVVDRNGEVLSPSLFRAERRDLRCGVRHLLARNAITGMTALFSQEVTTHALPFPRQGGTFFHHDLWLGLVAAAKGPVAVVRRPTVSYRQHGGNAVGVVGGRQGGRRDGRAWLRSRFGDFALASFLAKSLMLRVEEVAISQPHAFDRKRLRALRPYLRHFGLGLALYGDVLPHLLQRRWRHADYSFGHAVVKSGRMVWAVRQMLRLDLCNRLKEFDDKGYSRAPGFPPRPGAVGRGEIAGHPSDRPAQVWFTHLDQRRSASFRPVPDATRSRGCSILVPTLNPTEIFAGIATALDLGLGLAARGVPTRFVATDLPIQSEDATRAFLRDRCAGGYEANRLANVELACGVQAREISFHEDDVLVATAWWTAHVARHIIRAAGLRQQTFQYLIQDFEPNFYPWGTDYASAMETYRMPCRPIFNTTLLKDYFDAQGLGFPAAPPLVFRPSIDLARFGSLTRVPGRRKRRIAVYGRPEVPRNMFPICIEALAEFIRVEGLQEDETEILSVGMAHDPVLLPGGLKVNSLGKLPFEEYPLFLTTVDLGLALMYSPHPSHLPLEMAAAGARVVTNEFGPKNLSTLSPLIHTAEATPSGVADALSDAWRALDTPADAAHRSFDLGSLGLPMDEVARRLADELRLDPARPCKVA